MYTYVNIQSGNGAIPSLPPFLRGLGGSAEEAAQGRHFTAVGLEEAAAAAVHGAAEHVVEAACGRLGAAWGGLGRS